MVGCQSVMMHFCPPERTLASLFLSVMATAISLTHSLHRSHPERTETRQKKHTHTWAAAPWEMSSSLWIYDVLLKTFRWVKSTGETWMFATVWMFSWLWFAGTPSDHHHHGCVWIIYKGKLTHSASDRLGVKYKCQGCKWNASVLTKSAVNADCTLAVLSS